MLLQLNDLPDPRHFLLYEACRDEEKRAAVQLSGLLQATSSGYLIVGVPAALVRGVFDALHAPGISLPAAIDGGALRAGIVVMTPDELKSIGGRESVTERGKQYSYQLGDLEETPARDWPGVSTCWHLRIKSPDLGALRRSYGLPSKLEGDCDFSIVIACRKVGVLTSNAISKSTQQESQKLPEWTRP